MDILILVALLGIVGFDRSPVQPRASLTTKCPHCQTVVKRQEHGQTCSTCRKAF